MKFEISNLPSEFCFQIGRSSEKQIDFTVVDTWLAANALHPGSCFIQYCLLQLDYEWLSQVGMELLLNFRLHNPFIVELIQWVM